MTLKKPTAVGPRAVGPTAVARAPERMRMLPLRRRLRLQGTYGGRKLCAYSYVPLSVAARSEEHTSELQSQSNLVCRLLLEKKKKHHVTRDALSDGRRMPSMRLQ